MPWTKFRILHVSATASENGWEGCQGWAHPPSQERSRIRNLPPLAGGWTRSVIHFSLGHSARMDLLPLVHSQSHPHPNLFATKDLPGSWCCYAQHWVLAQWNQAGKRERHPLPWTTVWGLNSVVIIIWSLLSLFMFQSRTTREGPS